MKYIYSALAALALFVPVTISQLASAEEHLSPAQQRAELMSGIRANIRPLSQMARGGEIDWAVVAEAGDFVVNVAEVFPTLMVEGSFSARGTNPAVLDDLDGLQAEVDVLNQAGLGFQAAAAAQDAAAFQEAFGVFGSTCRSCHTKYRL